MNLKHAIEETPTGFVSLYLRSDCHLIADRNCKVLGFYLIAEKRLLKSVSSNLDSEDLAATRWSPVTHQEFLEVVTKPHERKPRLRWLGRWR